MRYALLSRSLLLSGVYLQQGEAHIQEKGRRGEGPAKCGCASLAGMRASLQCIGTLWALGLCIERWRGASSNCWVARGDI